MTTETHDEMTCLRRVQAWHRDRIRFYEGRGARAEAAAHFRAAHLVQQRINEISDGAAASAT